MRLGLRLVLCCMLAAGGAMARGGGGGARGGGFRGGGFVGGRFRGGFGFGGFRGGTFGRFGFNRFGFVGGFGPGWGWGWSPWLTAWGWPLWGWGWPLWGPDYYCDPYYSPCGSPYSSPYASVGYAGYQISPNVTVVYPPPAYASASTGPAVIRQYDEYGQEIPPTQAPAANEPAASAQAPIYLIAFNGTSVIYAAMAYWVDGNMLHYVTLEHQERQAPLSTVNRALSLQLNRERRVPFQLPAQ